MHSPTDSCILPQESLATSQHDETARVQPEPLSLRPSVEKRQRKLRDICEYVANILRDLCQKDSRFLYLQEAIAEFLDGDLGLRELGCRTQHVASTLSLQGEDGLITQDIKSEPILRSHIIPDVDMGDYLFLAAPFEILSSVIYEILDVFNIDITVQEATVPHKTLAYLDLLHRLYDRTRNREPKPRKLRIHSFEFNSHFNSNFVYQSKLDLTTDQVRVVKLSPGSEDNDIKCSLKVHSIKENGIPEALSYVWGKEISEKNILVDMQPFSVTKNLLEILRGLRHPTTSRTIWIDAICINQGDYEERNRQVRLMRDIYSQARNTVIYLTKGDVNLKLRQGEQLALLPTNFGGTTIDQFDLESILHEFQKYSIEPPWSEMKYALYIMLFRYVQHIFSHAWWERIWTLQEGALPASPPIIYFQGHSCKFQTLQLAINILPDAKNWSSEKTNLLFREILHNKNKDARTDEVLKMHDIIRSQGPVIFDRPLLNRLRQGSKNKDGNAIRSLFQLLGATDTYRATDPRDKIYALESLLPRCVGKLIPIDYNENYETLFTYATARFVNSVRSYHIAAKFNLLLESTTRNNAGLAATDDEVSSTPSWTLDFSYCDSKKHTGILELYAGDVSNVVTLNEFLYHNASKIAKSHEVGQNLVFATPSTLFCDGINIDDVYETGIIPENKSSTFEEDETPKLFFSILFLAFKIQKKFRRRQRNSRDEEEISIHSKAVNSLMPFFCLCLDTDSFPEGENDEFFAVHLKEAAGKTYFTTENGLVGIATAPVRKGDCLCLLNRAPVYLVLRAVSDMETEGQDGRSKAAQRHRIVARAAVKGADLPTLRASSPNCRFQYSCFQIV